MSLNINNNYSRQSYASVILSKYQDKTKDTSELENKDKDTEKLHKKKQVVSEKEGQYYCTYMVDDEGQKLLINKVLISQVSGQNELLNSTKSDNTEFYNPNVLDNTKIDLEFRQKLDLESKHKKNMDDIMNMLSGSKVENDHKQLNKILMELSS